jgi:valyl-tRNA synthetase
LLLEDRWIISRLHRTIAVVNDLMTKFEFGEAQRTIYDFLWGDYCDWYIEIAKIRLRQPAANSPIPVLIHVLDISLRLLHPFMPFITEELWQNLKRYMSSSENMVDSIMVAPYPQADMKQFDEEAERVMLAQIDIIRSIRNSRAQYKVPVEKWIESRIFAGDHAKYIQPYLEVIQTLGRTRPVVFLDTRLQIKDENIVVTILRDSEVYIPLAGMVDLKAERQRLENEAEQAQAELTRLETRLTDKQFLGKAPAAIIEKERQRLADIKDRFRRLSEQIGKL